MSAVTVNNLLCASCLSFARQFGRKQKNTSALPYIMVTYLIISGNGIFRATTGKAETSVAKVNNRVTSRAITDNHSGSALTVYLTVTVFGTKSVLYVVY